MLYHPKWRIYVLSFMLYLTAIQRQEVTKKGKKSIYNLIIKDCKKFDYLRRLNCFDYPQDKVASIIERFMINLYKGNIKKDIGNLNILHKELYVRLLSKTKLTSDFDLAILPPTSCAAKQHAFRAFHTLQQWKGVHLDPCEWGWYRDIDGIKPHLSTKPPIPDSLANIISCGCKKGCGKKCSCRKIGKECRGEEATSVKIDLIKPG